MQAKRPIPKFAGCNFHPSGGAVTDALFMRLGRAGAEMVFRPLKSLYIIAEPPGFDNRLDPNNLNFFK
jgi:hypothetical protein